MNLKANFIAYLALTLFWLLYIIMHMIDFIYVYAWIVFIYEFFIGGSFILFYYIIGLLRAAIPYIFIYIGLSVLNHVIHLVYKGRTEFKIFGIDLLQSTYNNKSPYWIFFFKEYYYVIFLLCNISLFIIIFYFELFYNIFLIGIIICFYLFLVLHILLKHYFNKYANQEKSYLHWVLNLSLAAIIAIFISVVGEAITQVIDVKIDLSNYWYNLIQTKDAFFQKLKLDPHWLRFYHTYKNEKLSAYYLFLKNQGLNNNLLNNMHIKGKYISEDNYYNMLNESNKVVIEKKTLQDLNNLNNIYINSSNVWYEYVYQQDNQKQFNVFKNIQKANNNTNWRTHLLNVYSTHSTHFSNSVNMLNDLSTLLDKTEHYNIKPLLITKEQVIEWKSLNNKYILYLKNKASSYDILKYKDFYSSEVKAKIASLNLLLKPAQYLQWYNYLNLNYINYINNASQDNIYEHISRFNVISADNKNNEWIEILNNKEDKLNYKYDTWVVLNNLFESFKNKITIALYQDDIFQELNVKDVSNYIIYQVNYYIKWWETNFYIINKQLFHTNMSKYDFNKKYYSDFIIEEDLKDEEDIATFYASEEQETDIINQVNNLLDRNLLYFNMYKKAYSYIELIGNKWRQGWANAIALRNDRKACILFFCKVDNKVYKWPLLRHFGFSKINLIDLKVKLLDVTFFIFNKNEVIINYENKLYVLNWRFHWIYYIRSLRFDWLLFKHNKSQYTIYSGIYQKVSHKFYKWCNNFYKNDNNIEDLNKQADKYIESYDKNIDVINVKNISTLELKWINFIKEVANNAYTDNPAFKKYILQEGMVELIASYIVNSKLELFEVLDLFKRINEVDSLSEFNIEKSWKIFASVADDTFSLRTFIWKAIMEAVKNAYEKYYNEPYMQYRLEPPFIGNPEQINSEYSCRAERIVAEKMSTISNCKEVSEMLFDVRNFLYFEDLYDTYYYENGRALNLNVDLDYFDERGLDYDFESISHEIEDELLFERDIQALQEINSYALLELEELAAEYDVVKEIIDKILHRHGSYFSHVTNENITKLTYFIKKYDNCNKFSWDKLYKMRGRLDPKIRVLTEEEYYYFKTRFNKKAISHQISDEVNIGKLWIRFDNAFYLLLLKESVLRRLEELLAELNQMRDDKTTQILDDLIEDKKINGLRELDLDYKIWNLDYEIHLQDLELQQLDNEIQRPDLKNYLTSQKWDNYNKERYRTEQNIRNIFFKKK